MNVFLLATFATLAALVTPGQGVKEISGFTYIGTVTSGGSGFGILSTSNLYVQKDMNTQNGAFNGCEAAGMTLLRIPDPEKEEQVRQKMNQAGLTVSWTSGEVYGGRWVWDGRTPITAGPNWLNGGGVPAISNNGVYYAITSRYDFGLDLKPPSTPLVYICETLRNAD